MKRKNTTATWIRDILILVMAGWIIMDQMAHQWNKGFQQGVQRGFQEGFKQGLQRQPQVWKSGQEPAKITESRLFGQDAHHTT